jgi:hypothetical protein
MQMLRREAVMSNTDVLAYPDEGLDGADAETRVVVDVLAMLHGRVEAALAEDNPAPEAQLTALTGQMVHSAAEIWKSVGRRAFDEAEGRLAGVAVDAILALMACRRALGS